jgi:hypothetical protein
LFPYRIFTGKHPSVTFRGSCIYWWNDLERDEIYTNWSVNLDEFSEETKPLRKNLVTFVPYFDLWNLQYLYQFDNFVLIVSFHCDLFFAMIARPTPILSAI